MNITKIYFIYHFIFYNFLKNKDKIDIKKKKKL